MKAVIDATSGGRSDILQSPADELRSILSEKQSKRLDSALNQNIQVYPNQTGTYTVISYSSEGEQSKYTVDLKYEDAQTCTCEDFMYRCDVSNGESCKHIWRTRLLIRVDALPEPSIDPYDWILDELAMDVSESEALRTEGSISDRTVQEVQNLYSRVKSAHRIGIDYVEICLKRASIFRQIID